MLALLALVIVLIDRNNTK
ncbi:hypothetical protein [Lacticaseibacillus zeae]